MRRILAEVIEADQSPPDLNDHSDLPFRKVRCLVKAVSGIPDAHHLPADAKDATCVIEREALFPWEYSPGTKVILNPSECVDLIGKKASIPEMPSLRGRVMTYKTDINSDGFTERIVENSFIRVVIGPRFGARIWELHHKRRGINVLHQTCDYNNDYSELGGQEEYIIQGDGRGEFWNAEFAEKEVSSDENGMRLVYEYKSEKTKGLTVIKEISIPVDQPVVTLKATCKYEGAEQPPKDDKPDELEIMYWSRTGIAMESDPVDSNVVSVSTKGKLKQIQRQLGWPDPRCWSLSAPYAISENQSTGIGTLLLMNKDRLHYFKTWWSRDFHTLEACMQSVKIPRDSEQSYTQVFAICDAACAEADGIAFVTVGPHTKGETPVFVLTTSAESDQSKLSMNGKTIQVTTDECVYDDAATVRQGTVWLKRVSDISDFTEIRSNGRCWTLDCGGVR